MNINQAPSHAPAPTDTTASALSPRKIAANRANALQSTGPRTAEGKETARLNAIKHGIFSSDVTNVVLEGHARVEEFNTVLDALLAEYDPQTVRERILIDEVAACCWRIRRVLRYECRETWVDDQDYRDHALTQSPTEEIQASIGYDHQGERERHYRRFRRAGLDTFQMPAYVDLDKIIRYERLVKRNLYRALYTLERIRAARQNAGASDAAPLPDPFGFSGDIRE